jgi:hypothetical protein
MTWSGGFGVYLLDIGAFRSRGAARSDEIAWGQAWGQTFKRHSPRR